MFQIVVAAVVAVVEEAPIPTVYVSSSGCISMEYHVLPSTAPTTPRL